MSKESINNLMSGTSQPPKPKTPETDAANYSWHRCARVRMRDDFNRRPLLAISLQMKNYTPGKLHVSQPSHRPEYMLLGAYGDICAMLPFFRMESRRRREPVTVIVSRVYADIFDGVSYVKPVIFSGHYYDCAGALNQCRSSVVGHVEILQCYGNNGMGERKTDSFVKEMWRLAGQPDAWDKYPLVFDNRKFEREYNLCLQEIDMTKPRLILVSSIGKSSPFPHDLVELIENEFSDCQVINLGEVKAEKPYDLLGLFDRAAMLVSIDTMHLHLARASSVPVIALRVDSPTPWQGCPRYLNQIASLPYSQFEQRRGWLLKLMHGYLEPEVRRPMFHVYSDYDRKGDNLRRHELAKLTWMLEMYRLGQPVKDSDLTRFSDTIGDTDRKTPFLKDMIEFAIAKHNMSDNAAIVLTNDDTCFAPGITKTIVRQVGLFGAAYAHRWDFLQQLSRPLDACEIRQGRWYPGCDLFVFTVGWWKLHRDEFPDFVLACECWDWILRELIKLHGGSEIIEGIYHEWHTSYWEEKRFTNAGNIYNRKLAREWLIKHNLPLNEINFKEKT